MEHGTSVIRVISFSDRLRWARHNLGLLRHVHMGEMVRRPWLLWFYVFNREARRRYNDLPPARDPLRERIIRDLRVQGISVTHIDELFPSCNLLPVLEARVRGLSECAGVKTKKKFLHYLFDAMPLLDPTDPFIKAALDEKVLGVASGYLGMWTKLLGFTLNITTPVAKGEKAVQSQRWHRDPDDKKMCKLFLYLNDVDASSGPFTYVRGSQYGGKYRSFFPQLPPAGNYPPEGAVERHVDADDMQLCTGRAGTIIFCDTTGLHRGGYATQKERIMFTSVYVSPAHISQVAFRCADGFPDAIHGLTEIQRYALI